MKDIKRIHRFKLIFLLSIALMITTLAFGESKSPQALAKEYFKTMMLPIYQGKKDMGQNELMEATFGKDMIMSSLEKMEPEKFMNGFMNILAVQLGDVKIKFDRIEVLGVVEEGDARHVLTRVTAGIDELAITQFEVLSFIPYNKGWKLQLNAKIKGMAKALKSMYTAK